MWENQEVFRVQTFKITALSIKMRGMEFTGIDCALFLEQIRMVETCVSPVLCAIYQLKQSLNIKAFSKLRKSAAETLVSHIAVYGDEALKTWAVYDYNSQFKNGRQVRVYEEHSNSSARSKNDENVAVCTVMTSDWSVAIEQIAYKIVISCG
jgi:hypothetical protein